VRALALPALMTTLRTFSDSARICRDSCTGAAAARLVVNMAATELGSSATSKARSALPLGLTPVLSAAPRQPGTDRTSPSGRGSRCSFMQRAPYRLQAPPGSRAPSPPGPPQQDLAEARQRSQEA